MIENKILIGREFLPELLSRIGEAKHTIYIVIFDWRFYPEHLPGAGRDLLQALRKAALKGVSIKVIANNDYVRDNLKRFNIPCKRCYNFKMVHAKMILFDTESYILGSHNLSQSAFERNLEISTYSNDKNCAARLGDYFLKLWG